ncbi:MAG: TetR/AcrR family transcriptional regulator [Pseudomonadota bacterium]
MRLKKFLNRPQHGLRYNLPMPVDKQYLSERISQVFVQRGYDGATLTHLAQATGLSKATLYHHFPGGKPEMATTLVHQAIAMMQRLVFTPLSSNPQPEQALVELIKGFSQYVNHGQSDCLLAVFSHHSTANVDISGLQTEISQQFGDWHQLLAATLIRSGTKPKRAHRQAP